MLCKDGRTHIYRINAILSEQQLPFSFVCINGQVEPKIMWNFKGPQVAKQSWQKRTKLEDSHFSILKLSYKTIEVKTVLDWLYPKNVFGVKKKRSRKKKNYTSIKYIYMY